MSSSIRPNMVFSPIFNNGFGKFFVNSPNLVAYPAAITTFFNFQLSILYLYKSRPIVGLNPKHLEGFLILWELL